MLEVVVKILTSIVFWGEMLIMCCLTMNLYIYIYMYYFLLLFSCFKYNFIY